jgi:threonine synthase
MYHVKCKQCDHKVDKDPIGGVCPVCEELIEFQYSSKWDTSESYQSMWRYNNLLPIQDKQNIVSLGEGKTPLLKSNVHFGSNIYLKDESRNPTGSMKDRAMSVAYSKAKELNIKRSIIISAGGAGIAASAYASRAGIENVILIPPGVSQERIMAMQIYGSEIIEVQGNIEDCLEVAQEMVNKYGWYETSTYKKANPYTIEGPKTIAYEIFEQLEEIPDYIFVPVGGGGTLTGIWKGFNELKDLNQINYIPALVGIQNTNFNGLEIALRKGYTKDNELHLIDIDSSLPTVTGAIRHSYVPDGEEALEAIRNSGGKVVTVDDEEAMEAQKMIADTDGLFVEPSSAIPLIAYQKMLNNNEISSDKKAVLILTGSGYREIATTLKYHGQEPKKFKTEECFNYLLSKDKQHS